MAERTKFLDHILELRARLIKVIFSVLLLSAACFPFAADMFHFLAAPAQGKLVFTHPIAGMMAHFKLAIMAGCALSAPYVFFHVFEFIKPAFKVTTRLAILGFTLMATVLFLCGVSFAWWVLPTFMTYLLSFVNSDLQAFLSVDDYFSFIFMLVLGIGFAFEMPLGAYVMARMGWLSPAFMLRHWRAAILANLVLAAIITPTPDLVSMFVVFIPLVGLYLASWGIVLAVGKKS